MAVTAKKLGQTALNTTATTIVTGVAGGSSQITEIWLTNTNSTTARTVKIYAHGTATANTLVEELSLDAKASKIFNNAKIVLAAGETLSALQDTGTDVIATAYGIEEV